VYFHYQMRPFITQANSYMQICLFFYGQQPNSSLCFLFFEVSRSHTHTHTHTHTGQDSSKRAISSFQRPLITQLTTNVTDENLCLLRDSNPRFQQSSGFRPTPQTVRPLGSAVCVLRGLIIQTRVF